MGMSKTFSSTFRESESFSLTRRLSVAVSMRLTFFSSYFFMLSFQVSLPFKPVYLGPCVLPDYISFLVLEIPGCNDDDVSFPDPDPFFHGTRNSAHPDHSIHATEFQAVCTEKAFNRCQDFVVFPAWGAYSCHGFFGAACFAWWFS